MTIKKLVMYMVTDGVNYASFPDMEGLTLAELVAKTGIQVIDANYEAQATAQSGAVIGFGGLPAFLKTMTADEAMTHIHSSVLGGKTEAQINSDIDALANTVAGMKIGLKTIGVSLVAIRDILELIVKLLLFIRDLVIRFRQ